MSVVLLNDDDDFPKYIYRVTCHEQEISLCSLEMRALWETPFETKGSTMLLQSNIAQDVNRSPFVKYRIEVLKMAHSFQTLVECCRLMELAGMSYKVIALDEQLDGYVDAISYEQRRMLEQALGVSIGGKVNLKTPDIELGVVRIEQKWFLGILQRNEAIWQAHNDKPRQYSTALSTKVARAIVNIAVPNLHTHVKLYDPCCGIGTVLMEACSQGISCSGSDLNPLAVVGARENLAAFQYNCDVTIQDIRKITDHYDVAILDLPYNHCSVLSPQDRHEMLSALKSIASSFVIVSVEPILNELLELGFIIDDTGKVEKMNFSRDVFVCHI